MENLKKTIFTLFLITGLTSTVFSQSIGLNTPGIDDYLRRKQLTGEIPGYSSFSIRPLYPVEAFDRYSAFDLDSSFQDFDISKVNRKFGKKKQGTFHLTPISILSQHNSDLTFGINDGAMIPNKGWQTLYRLGFFAPFGKFSVQIQPEFIIAQNQEFIGMPLDAPAVVYFYYEYLNRIDMPEQMGERPYKKFLPGQSSIRFNPGDFSIGISTENLWWGPARRSSLLLSNNAPGFTHLTLNTRKPIKTPIGHFESQVIAGLLNSTVYAMPHQDMLWQRSPAYVPKRESSDRYLSGLILTYQPKWVPGLSIGYASTNHMYQADMDELKDYLPIFNGEKKNANVFNPKREQRQQFSSGFFRWLSQEGHFEFYGEYGTNGNSRRLKDFLITPERNRGFTFGFSNLFNLEKPEQYIQLSAEMTQTGQTIREGIRNLETWYIHDHVRHGYTHQGQVLGMGYGPAANVNWMEVAWVKNFNRIGFQFERIVYNNDFYYYMFEGSKDWRRKYIDLVPGLFADWRVGNLLLSGSLQYVNTWNYKWYLENDPNRYFVPGDDRQNITAKIGLSYILK